MLFKLLIVLLFIVSARFSFINTPDSVVLAWVLGWGAWMLISNAWVLNSILLFSFVIFFEQSLWYIGGLEVPLTIYEREFFNFKPIEILIYAFLANVAYRGKIIFPDYAFYKYILFWAIAILLGVIAAVFNDVSIYKMFVFSEFRTILLGFAVFIILISTQKETLAEVYAWFLALTAMNCLISFLELYGDVVLLWPSSASGYSLSGSGGALFGGDPEVAIVVFAFSFSIFNIIFTKYKSSNILSYITPGFRSPVLITACIAALLFTSVILSYRRGAILSALMIVLISLRWWAKRGKVGILAFPVVLLSSVLFAGLVADINVLPQSITTVLDRFTGADIKVQQSNSGHLNDVTDALEVLDFSSVLFGKGVGYEISSTRKINWGGDAESLIVHQSFLHTLIKFGIVGLIVYIYLFYGLLKEALIISRKKNIPIVYKSILFGVSAFLISDFIWQLFTPPYYQNFRRTALVMLAMASIFIVKEIQKDSQGMVGSSIENRL